MLKSMQTAIYAAGKSRPAISRETKISRETLWRWMTGKIRVPEIKRQILQRAIGDEYPIDWEAYEAEYIELAKADPIPRKIPATRAPKGEPAEPAQRPAQARQRPAQALAPASPPKNPIKAPVEAPKRSFWCSLIIDDGEDAFA